MENTDLFTNCMNEPQERPLAEIADDLEERIAAIPAKYQKLISPIVRELRDKAKNERTNAELD